MKNKYFEEVKGNFGFGFMRLPMNGEEVDHELTCKMVDTFMENGFNYFDTAHNYIKGKSEIALRECLVKRYPREDFLIVDKLTPSYFQKEEDIRPLFQEQLDACGCDHTLRSTEQWLKDNISAELHENVIPNFHPTFITWVKYFWCWLVIVCPIKHFGITSARTKLFYAWPPVIFSW